MRPCVICERLTGGPPRAKDIKGLRSFFWPDTINEAVHRRHVLLFQSVEDRLSNLKARDRGWPGTMSRQVIKSDRKLLGNGMQRCESKKQAQYFQHPVSLISLCGHGEFAAGMYSA